MTTAIVLFGHGSRDAAWRAPIEAVAARIAARSPTTPVRCAYLELTTPDLPMVATELIADGAILVRIVPMFLGVGRHARVDLPALVEALAATYPAVRFELQPAVGEDPRVLDRLADVALEP